jgi:cell division protein FtsB
MQRNYVVWIAVSAALIMALVSAANEGGVRRYFRLRSDIKQLEARNQMLTDSNAQLRREVEGMRSDAKVIERAAREELGFVKPGEIIFALEN